METLTKFITLTALFIGVITLERTYQIRDLQRTLKATTTKLEQTRERIRMTAHLAVERIDRFIQLRNDKKTPEKKTHLEPGVGMARRHFS
jgi:hypothetical protein